MPISQYDNHPIIIGITMGDASGIGPEVIVKALDSRGIRRLASFLIIGDASVIEKTEDLLGISSPIRKIVRHDGIDLKEGFVNLVRSPLPQRGKGSRLRRLTSNEVNLLDMKNIPKGSFQFGKVSAIAGQAAMEYVEKAVKLIKNKKIDAIVTGPINKEAINLAGYHYPGHTEYLAHLCGEKNVGMMLVGGPLRVVLVTIHLALKDIGSHITEEKVYRAIRLAHQALRDYFGISSPRIGVCSLNPHGGEGGMFGGEEREIIAPAVLRARKAKMEASGPLPGDAIFYQAYHGEIDVVVAMYHDQGSIPLKMIARDRGVNITLGLPFIRTSPDHGTGFDIVGKGIANPQSMIEAIKMAVSMKSNSRAWRHSGVTKKST